MEYKTQASKMNGIYYYNYTGVLNRNLRGGGGGGGDSSTSEKVRSGCSSVGNFCFDP